MHYSYEWLFQYLAEYFVLHWIITLSIQCQSTKKNAQHSFPKGTFAYCFFWLTGQESMIFKLELKRLIPN